MAQEQDVKVRVGILTDGKARIEGHRILNAVMGHGFHWQQCYELLLPPEAEFCGEGPCGETVVSMPVEVYLRSVVASEMNPAAPAEFLRAHAIVSRSWVMGKILRVHAQGGGTRSAEELRVWADTAAHSGFDVCNDDHCQRFQGVQPLPSSLREALKTTEHIVLTDAAGQVIDARFSKCCGGFTEAFSTCWQDVDYPYLPAQPDPWCDPSRISAAQMRQALKDYDADTDYYRWQTCISAAEVAANLRERFGMNVGRITALEPVSRGLSGRIHRLRVAGTEGAVLLGKELAVRRLLSPTHLLSSAFEVERQGDRFLLRGRGWGHGVGMCQTGAAAMAFAGKSAQEILAFYYPASKLAKLAKLAKIATPQPSPGL